LASRAKELGDLWLEDVGVWRITMRGFYRKIKGWASLVDI
jgi:hypothetical protein